MDPTNNSTPTPNPVPGAAPVPDPISVPPVAPSAPVPPADPSGSVPPTAPVAAASPVESPVVPPVAPGIGGEAAVPSMEQLDSAADAVVEPLVGDTAVGNDFATLAGVEPVPPVARPTNIDGVNSVPVAEPNGVSPVGAGNTPVEPAPAPSAANGQSIDGILGNGPFVAPNNTPSVSFADPATQPEDVASADVNQPTTAVSKKKSSKAVLITLSVIAFVVAAVLGVVLVMMLTETGPFGTSNSGNSSGSSVENGSDESDGDKDNGNNDSGGGNTTGDNENNGNGGAVVNPGEDTIVCTMTQDDVSSDGVSSTSTITMTLYFTNNSFSRVSVRGETMNENSTTPAITTMEMSAAEMLEMSGIDWDTAGVKPNEDGSVAATKEQVLEAINSSSYSEMTCISPSSM